MNNGEFDNTRKNLLTIFTCLFTIIFANMLCDKFFIGQENIVKQQFLNLIASLALVHLVYLGRQRSRILILGVLSLSFLINTYFIFNQAEYSFQKIFSISLTISYGYLIYMAHSCKSLDERTLIEEKGQKKV